MTDHQEIVNEWLRKANNDFLNAQKLMINLDESSADLICFLSQQCVEKLLKAVLVLNNQDFLKIHDLEKLTEMAKPYVNEFSFSEEQLEWLSHIGIAARYPETITNEGDVEEAFEICKDLRGQLLEYFEKALKSS